MPLPRFSPEGSSSHKEGRRQPSDRNPKESNSRSRWGGVIKAFKTLAVVGPLVAGTPPSNPAKAAEDPQTKSVISSIELAKKETPEYTVQLVSEEALADWAREHPDWGWWEEGQGVKEEVVRAWSEYLQRFSNFPTPRLLAEFLAAKREGKEAAFKPEEFSLRGASLLQRGNQLLQSGQAPLERFYEERGGRLEKPFTVDIKVKRAVLGFLKQWVDGGGVGQLRAAVSYNPIIQENDIEFVVVAPLIATLPSEEARNYFEKNSEARQFLTFLVRQAWVTAAQEEKDTAPRRGVEIDLGAVRGGEAQVYANPPTLEQLLQVLERKIFAELAHLEREEGEKNSSK